MEKDNQLGPLFEALHGDLKSLNEKVVDIQITLSKMEGQNIGIKLEKHELKLEKLEEFKSKITGALIIINLVWGISAAFIIWKMTR